VFAGDAAFDHASEAFAGVFVDDRHDLDRPPVGGHALRRLTACAVIAARYPAADLSTLHLR
jgi:hypothetical protein